MTQRYWWLNDESRTILERGYLLEGESVENAVDRVCNTACKILKRPDLFNNFKDNIEFGWMSLSTPIWCNFGTDRGLPISCYGTYVPDSIVGISDALTEVIYQTKTGGGTSAYFGDIRPRGSKINGNGTSNGAVSFMKLFDTAVSVISQGCYDDKTEILTERGWMSFEELSNNINLRVAQVTNENIVEFIKPTNHFKYLVDTEMILFKDSRNINLMVTPNHNMIFKRWNKNNIKVINKTKYSYKNKSLTERMYSDTADAVPMHRDVAWLHSSYTGQASSAQTLSWEERFLIALQADGSLVPNCNTAYTFHFSKQRKIDRLDLILFHLNYKFSKTIQKDGTTAYYINALQKFSKIFDWVDITQVSSEWSREFLAEILLWDGWKADIVTNGSYSSTIKYNVDVIQSLACLCGFKCRITKDLREKCINKMPIYKIWLSDGYHFGVEKITKEMVPYNGYVYCVEVPTHQIIVRRGGHTLVCGNSVRRGNFATYLDIDHGDIKEFLSIKDIGSDIQNIFTGVNVPDYWLKEMIEGDKAKREIWAKVIESRREKGIPYINFIDNINKNKPQWYKDRKYQILASNLCNEINLPSSVTESFVCCLLSKNLELYDEWKNTNSTQTSIYFLDAVMEEFIQKSERIPHLQRSHFFAKNHRALGLGVLGYHSYLQKNNIAFESLEAKSINNEMFKVIKEQALAASSMLAKEYGEPDVLKGYGFRNATLLAIAPTTSSSAILGQASPGIEPYSSNYYKAGLAKGNFMRKNKYLCELLKSKDSDIDEVWNSILVNQGSVQHLDFLSKHEKDVFKTFKEISQMEIIIQASIRQKHICQGQSLNLNIPPEVSPKDLNKLILEAWALGIKGLYYQRSESVSQNMIQNITNCVSCEG